MEQRGDVCDTHVYPRHVGIYVLAVVWWQKTLVSSERMGHFPQTRLEVTTLIPDFKVLCPTSA